MKRILSLILTFLMLFSLPAFVACNASNGSNGDDSTPNDPDPDSDSSDNTPSQDNPDGSDAPTDTETPPEESPIVNSEPVLPFYDYLDLNGDVLTALFDGAVTYTDLQTGIGSSFNMHFVDFIKVGDEYRAYYIKWDGSKGGIGLATTKDGLNFVDEGFVLEADPDDGWDNTMSSFPGIWYEDGLYYLVYEGAGTDNRGAVALAVSEDGYTFEKKGIIIDYNHDGTGLAGANTGTPDIFKADGIWYVTYHSFNWTDCQICVAYGEDLMNLTLCEDNPVIPTSEDPADPDSGTTGRRDILYYNGYYYMVYEISSDQPYGEATWGHRFARSEDMLHWEISPIIYPTTGGGMGNDGPAWLVIDGEVYVYFRTGGSTSRYRLVMAE